MNHLKAPDHTFATLLVEQSFILENGHSRGKLKTMQNSVFSKKGEMKGKKGERTLNIHHI